MLNSVRVIAETQFPGDPAVCPPYLQHSYSLMYANAFCFKAWLPQLWCYSRGLGRSSSPQQCLQKFFLPCVTTCSLIFSNANIMSEPVKTVPFSLYLTVHQSRVSFFSHFLSCYICTNLRNSFCSCNKITVFNLFLL